MSRSILYKTDKGEWRWVRRAVNGEVIAASTESYKRKANAIKNYLTVSNEDAPPLVEETEE